MTNTYIHLLSFNCKYHESTFYTLYTTNTPSFNKRLALASLRQGAVFGKYGHKERHPKIVELAKKYHICDVFSIKAHKIDKDVNPSEMVNKLNKKYSEEKANYIFYSRFV